MPEVSARERCRGEVLRGVRYSARASLCQLWKPGVVHSQVADRFVEWPPEKKAIDIGDFYADSSRVGKTLGWQPTTSLRQGLQRTIAFYRAHLHEYVPTAESPVAL